MSTYLASDQALTSPIPGTPYTKGRALYMAQFGGGNTGNLIGVFTAAGEGLKSRAWEGANNVFAVSNGMVVRGADTTAAVTAQLPMEGNGGIFEMNIVTRPTVGGLYFDLFRSAVSGSPNGYRLEILTTSVRLCQRVGGNLTYFGSNFPINDGDRVGLRWMGGSLSLIVNGEEKIIANTSDVARSGYCGLSAVQAATGFALDNLMVTTY